MVALAVEVAWDLLGLWEDEFVALIVNEQELLLPDLVNLGAYNLADSLAVLVVETVLLQLENL